MKIALVQQNYRVGDVAGNLEKMLRAARSLKEEGVDSVLFSGGALVGGELYGQARSAVFQAALHDAQAALEAFRHESGMNLVLEDAVCEAVKIYCAADSFQHTGPARRLAALKAEAAVSGRPVAWVNAVGAQTGTIYCGGSAVCFPDGSVVTLPLFEEATLVLDTLTGVSALRPPSPVAEWGDRLEQLRGALVLGIRDYFAKTGVGEACVALSGGIDSALVLALACEALGPERLRVLMLPSDYSTEHSVTDSEEMIRRLGIPANRVRLISIAPTFQTALTSLQPVLNDALSSAARALTEENMQARIRCLMTMALSNSTGALMLNTSNKSEAAVGYGTLYGDTSGALGVIGDLYKEDVYALSHYLNTRAAAQSRPEPIPEHILTKAPSAELYPGQKDGDSLPDYPVLDAILLRLVEGGRSAAEVVAEGFDAPTVERVCQLLLASDFKRFQLPPVLQVSACPFGIGWRWPIVATKSL